MFVSRRFTYAGLQHALRHQQKVAHSPQPRRASAPAAVAVHRGLVSAATGTTSHTTTSTSSSSSSSTTLIINAVGQDRLGIVSDITGMVIENGGNVSDSQAAKLGNHFSLMMMVHVPTGNGTQALKKQLSGMADMNVSVFETPSFTETSTKTPHIAYSGKFTLEGADHPGIAHKLTTALSQHGLSIDQMHTDQEIAPHGGTVLFRMRGIAQAAAPLCKTFDVNRIRNELRALGDDLNCEVDLVDVTDDTYEASFVAG